VGPAVGLQVGLDDDGLGRRLVVAVRGAGDIVEGDEAEPALKPATWVASEHCKAISSVLPEL
jgi:hypothetical protein